MRFAGLSALSVALVIAAACGRSTDEPIATAATTVTSTTTGSTTGSTITVAATARPTTASTAAPAADTAPTTGSSPTSATDPTPTPSAPGAAPTAETVPTTASTQPPASAPATVGIRLRLDRRVADGATEGFASFVRAVLTDERGWGRAGFEFSFSDTEFDYTVVLAEGAEVDALCLPYDTFGRFSCQIGPVVALNADRWRTAVDDWPATLDDYRRMLVNHEVGHLLGQHHPASRCAGPGRPAPVMAQQSSGVAPCTANPWPLPWEIDCAALGLEPLAPPFERAIELTCGPDGPVE